LLAHAPQIVRHFSIDVELIVSPAWWQHDTGPNVDGTLSCAPASGDTLQLRVGPAIARSLSTPDNAGEREIIRALLLGWRSWGARFGLAELAGLNDAAISGLLDRHVPLGRKKKILFLPGNVNPQLIEGELAPPREVQPFDEQQVLDALGDYCAQQLHLPEGPIPRGQRLRVLNGVVGFLYRELERLVATLSPLRLLESLVVLNESLVYRQEFRRLTVPTQIACFGSVSLMAERLRREHSQSAAAAVASRFLLEYVSARPPSGDRPFSMAVYDRLLALAAQMAGTANVSDAIHYNLTDRECAMTGSGRLAIGDRGNAP
jgi:hypothetical protein